MFNKSKPWYKSKTYWGGLIMFIAAAAETYIGVWFPVVTGDVPLVDNSDVATMLLKTVPLLFSAVGLATVMFGRNQANTTIG